MHFKEFSVFWIHMFVLFDHMQKRFSENMHMVASRCRILYGVSHLYPGLAEWSVPSGGMFLWLRLVGVEDSFSLITEKARAAEVLFVPGKVFMIDESAPSPYVRASYSLVSPEDMDKVQICFCYSWECSLLNNFVITGSVFSLFLRVWLVPFILIFLSVVV